MQAHGQCGVVCAARKLQALYHIRPTDGSDPTTVGRSARGCSQWQAWTASLNAPAVSSRLFFPFKTWFEKGGGQKFKEKNSTVNRFEASLPVKPVGNRLRHQQTHANVKCGSFRKRPKNMLLTSHRRAESRAAQVRLATLFAFHGAVQIIARSSPTHCLERRLVRFLRLHRATLCCADFRV